MPIVVGYEPVAAIGQAAYGAGLAERIQRVAEQQAQLDAQAAAEAMRQNFQRELTRRGMDERKAEQEAERAWRTVEAEKQREFTQTESSAQRLHGYLSGEETRTAAEERQKAAIKGQENVARIRAEAQLKEQAQRQAATEEAAFQRTAETAVQAHRRRGNQSAADAITNALQQYRTTRATQDVTGEAGAQAIAQARTALERAVSANGGPVEEPKTFWTSGEPGTFVDEQTGERFYRGAPGAEAKPLPAVKEPPASKPEITAKDRHHILAQEYEAARKAVGVNPGTGEEWPDIDERIKKEIERRRKFIGPPPGEQGTAPQSAPGPTGAPPPTRAERQAKFLQDNPTAAPLWSQAKGTADALRSPTYQRATPAQQQEMVVEYNRLMKQLEDLGFPLK